VIRLFQEAPAGTLKSVGKLLKNSRKAPGKLLKFHCKI